MKKQVFIKAEVIDDNVNILAEGTAKDKMYLAAIVYARAIIDATVDNCQDSVRLEIGNCLLAKTLDVIQNCKHEMTTIDTSAFEHFC